jgi:hypothetical protein
MNALERRRSGRISIDGEEAAVIHARDLDLPVRLVDLSKTGALVNFLNFATFGGAEISTGESLQLSLSHAHSVFQIMARVIRTTHDFIAVEFLDESEGSRKALEDKILAAETTGVDAG